MEDKDPGNFIFIDASGPDTITTPDYGRVVGGSRVKASKPAGTWDHFSVIGAISIYGIQE